MICNPETGSERTSEATCTTESSRAYQTAMALSRSPYTHDMPDQLVNTNELPPVVEGNAPIELPKSKGTEPTDPATTWTFTGITGYRNVG